MRNQFARCRSCQAEIFWCKNDTTGKTAPIDAAPDPGGPVTILDDGRYHVLTKAELEAGVSATRYSNHFQTCPDAKSHTRSG